jgi:hypothetical protein
VSVVAGVATTFAPSDITDLRARAYSNVGPIAKRWNTATAAQGANDYFTVGGWRSLPGATIAITTYTPNVPLLCNGSVRCQVGTFSAAARFELLVGVGPSFAWTETGNAFINGGDRQMGWSDTFVIPNPGSYTLRISGQATGGATGNLPTIGGGFSWLSAAWYDIASATG